MTRYRLSGTVEEAHLSSVIGAYSAAGLRSDMDPEITLSLMTKFHPSPNPDPVSRDYPAAPVAPKKRTQTKRASMRPSNGGEWPAKGSIYDVVLQSLREEPKTPTALRAVLTGRGFSAGSVNSAISRLAKASKVSPTGDGAWAAA